MKTWGIVAIVAGVLAVIYLAVSRGLVGGATGGVQIGPAGSQRGIIAPQPSQNYGGYLAATTAPQVSGILNGLLSGLGDILPHPSRQTPAPAQAANPASPSFFAQPSGPAPGAIQPTSFVAGDTLIPPAPIGPMVDPSVSYNATTQSAFDYSGLSGDNSFDENASLMFA